LTRTGLRRDTYVVYGDPVTAATNRDRITTITRDGLPADPEVFGGGSEPIRTPPSRSPAT
jgi:hypothetical protein